MADEEDSPHTAVFKKCTGRYFKVRDDDLSSKQGSLCTFKMILVIRKYFIKYIYIYLYLL